MFEKAPAGFGYAWCVAVAFVPGAFAAHLWAYQNLAQSERDSYLVMLLVVYLAPLVIGAVIVVVTKLVLGRIRQRYGHGSGTRDG